MIWMHRFRRVITTCLVLLALTAGMNLEAQDPDAISAIEIRGISKVSRETILFRTGFKVGDELKTVDFSKALQVLWEMKAFDDIKINVEDTEQGKKIIIIVVERPIIKEIDYRGGTEIGLTSIKDKVKDKKADIRIDAPYDPDLVRKVKDIIVDLAAEKGFRSPSIEVSLEPMGPGLARLLFDIKEGGKNRIYNIRFKGNQVFMEKQLKSIMKTSEHNWFLSPITSKDLLIDKSLDEDMELLKKAYWLKGYKDVFISKPDIKIEDFTTEKDKKKNLKLMAEARSPSYDLRATLSFQIVEGESFYEGDIKIEGNKVFTEAFFLDKYGVAKRDNSSILAKFLDLKPSRSSKTLTYFDLGALNEAQDKIREGYSNAGYILFRAEPSFASRVVDGKSFVDITLKVEEGERFTIRDITFVGNDTTKDKVLRRSFLLREGDTFGREAFKDSMLRLSQLTFFDVKDSEPKVEIVPDKNQVDLTIKGVEAGINELLFNGGYGELYGFSLGMSYATKNLGGNGDALQLSVNSGQFQKAVNISLTQPYVADLPYSLSTSIFSNSTDYDASRVGNANAYSQSTKGLSIGTGARLSNFFKDKQWAYFTEVSLGYSWRIVKISGGQNYYFRNANNELTSDVSLSVSYNTVDNPFKPTEGTRVTYSYSYGGWQFGGDRSNQRSNYEFVNYFSLGERNIFGFNLAYAHIQDLSEKGLLLYNFFRPGGENTIRGYRYGQVGSIEFDPNGYPVVVGGNKQFVANFEYAFKIADAFRFVIFYDAGNAWAPGKRVFSEALRQSVGAELRFFLPISPAPMRLIWSTKLNPYAYDLYGKNDFQFSIGTTF